MNEREHSASDLTPEQKRALQELLDDYKAAASEHVPGYKGGGLSRKIAVALIQGGWRRNPRARSVQKFERSDRTSKPAAR
jgi:hypothetical protein